MRLERRETEESKPPTLKGGSGGDGVFASHETRVPETKARADPLWDEEEKNTRGIEPVRSKIHRVRGWPFFSAFSLQKKPRPAWLTQPGSDADSDFSLMCAPPFHGMRLETA